MHMCVFLYEQAPTSICEEKKDFFFIEGDFQYHVTGCSFMCVYDSLVRQFQFLYSGSQTEKKFMIVI